MADKSTAERSRFAVLRRALWHVTQYLSAIARSRDVFGAGVAAWDATCVGVSAAIVTASMTAGQPNTFFTPLVIYSPGAFPADFRARDRRSATARR